MKKFFIKKEVFFICFLSCIVLFFIFNAMDVKEMKKTINEIQLSVVKENNIKKSRSWNDLVEAILKDKVLDKVNLKEVQGLFHKILGKREFNNFYYIQGKDDMMYYGTLLQGKEDTLKYAKRVRKAVEAANEKGAKTLFVLVPTKIIYGLSNTKGEFLLNDKNGIQDELLLSMQYYQVPALDLRLAMIESGLPIEELFYRTDNVWTTEAAFIAANAIVQAVEKQYEDNWDTSGYYMDRENYNSVVYKNATAGTFGRGAGVLYTGRDNFTVLYPKFETQMIWENLENNAVLEGSFEEVLITLDLEEGIYGNPGNKLYLSRALNRDRIINKNNPDGPKILCLRDAHFSPVASFLAPMCSQIDMVYARRDQNNIDYEKLILEEEYDYLIIENYPFNIEDNAFDYFKE